MSENANSSTSNTVAAAGDATAAVTNGNSPPPPVGPSSVDSTAPAAATVAAERPSEPSAADIAKISEIKRAIEQMRLMQSLQPSSSSGSGSSAQPKNVEEAKKKKYEFWETQPVPKMNDDAPIPRDVNEPIDPNTDVAKVRKEPLPLPEGFIWVAMDIDKNEELQELYTLLFENYVEDDDNMFRFNYSRDFLQWVLKPPHYNTAWYVGVRVAPKAGATKPGKLLGFVSAIPSKIRVYDKTIAAVEINFLCVHKKLRSKRLAPVLIKEITRRVNLTGVWQALYTAGVFIPKPVSTCRYYHRSLNPKKLIEVGFSSMSRNMNMTRTLKLYRLPEAPNKTCGVGGQSLRRAVKGDLKAMYGLFTAHMAKFDLVPVFEPEEFAHWILPREGVVESYVLEKPNTSTKKKDIIAFFSFYILPSTVMNHATHKEVKAAYSFYNVTGEEHSVSLVDLMADALVVAKNTGMDVFNALNQMENEQFLKELKFGSGDGSLHYYLFNWKCATFEPKQVGVVLQ